MTGEIRVISKEECDLVKEKSLIITSEAARVILTDMQTNCHLQQCAKIKGAADSWLLILDQSLDDTVP